MSCLYYQIQNARYEKEQDIIMKNTFASVYCPFYKYINSYIYFNVRYRTQYCNQYKSFKARQNAFKRYKWSSDKTYLIDNTTSSVVKVWKPNEKQMYLEI